MPTLVAQLEKTAKENSDSPAILFSDVVVSYHSLYDASVRLANGLMRMGIKKGDQVAIMLPNVPHFCISYYAVLMLGAVAVPINFMNDANEVTHQLADSGAGALITWQNFLTTTLHAFHKTSSCSHLIVLGEHIPSFSTSLTKLIAESEPNKPEVDIAGSDLAVINYTSGITDIAAGAELTHDALWFSASTFVDMLRITPQERLIAVLPLFHPLSQSIVMNASFLSAAPLVLALRFQAGEIVRIIQKHKVTLMPAVPGMFRALNEVQGDDLETPSLKYCVSYGGFLPAAILEEFESKFGALILKSYGLTEAGPLATSTRPSHERISESCGLPLMSVELQIRDKTGKILRPNHSGEIYIKSPGVMLGYHHQPEETKNRLQDGWLATGDIGYIDINHYLYIQERKDDVIIKGGFEIQAREVERIILDHPAIDEAAVIAVPDPVQGSEVKAFIVVKEGFQISNKELFDHCQNLLPVYKCPKFIEAVGSLPKTPTGRILKRSLRRPKKEAGSGSPKSLY